jgi:hypothetical protein
VFWSQGSLGGSPLRDHKHLPGIPGIVSPQQTERESLIEQFEREHPGARARSEKRRREQLMSPPLRQEEERG